MKISVVLATYNEEKNIKDCIDTVKKIADEIIIVDGESSDKTVLIARENGAKVFIEKNHPIFHINKEKALSLAKNEWILQLDADERVTEALAEEILKIVNMSDEEREKYQVSLSKRDLFLRHQELLIKRDGQIGTTEGSYNAFFIPRLNYFLGRYLKYGGVYPDGVIRLVRRHKAHFPCKSVHEQIEVSGKVGWLSHDLKHIDSPTFTRYLERNKRYVHLIATEIANEKNPKSILKIGDYLLLKPTYWFFLTYVRHKGFLDSWQGLVFSFFSALRFPRAYLIFWFKR